MEIYVTTVFCKVYGSYENLPSTVHTVTHIELMPHLGHNYVQTAYYPTCAHAQQGVKQSVCLSSVIYGPKNRHIEI